MRRKWLAWGPAAVFIPRPLVYFRAVPSSVAGGDSEGEQDNDNNRTSTQSDLMLSRPFPIAAIFTVIAAIPLTFLATSQYQLSLGSLPLFLVSLFVLLLVATWLVNAREARESDEPADDVGYDRELGEVKWFNASKGFGFITRDSGDDVFVHFRSIRGDGHRVLKDGQRVEFAVSESEKGLQAEDVAVAR